MTMKSISLDTLLAEFDDWAHGVENTSVVIVATPDMLAECRERLIAGAKKYGIATTPMNTEQAIRKEQREEACDWLNYEFFAYLKRWRNVL